MNRLNLLGTSVPAATAHQGQSSKRVSSGWFRFSYRFTTGHLLLGTVEGDFLVNLPHLVFNLRHLTAALQDQRSRTVLQFDRVFGQFDLSSSEVLFSGSDSGSGSFFCFNYRGSEAIVFDGIDEGWLASGWVPATWQVESLGGSDAAVVWGQAQAQPQPASLSLG
ncbi:hypothetical protein [Pseudanabaena sp. FACHB-2040]|uniref:hypothetical protein n=1 Tax=Pseudanabaena sp. FACHB-2040 TaxID=2692859 RepID=UPI0016839F84|nr:hypothetical protein [Pseudanabaena sp. FACHB-2040]MBD2259601.1 hypothetical protein [Pseudanabaena sp. FACHB-2040]